jgi:alpha-tubulin suppressor-like RCC1 family protein
VRVWARLCVLLVGCGRIDFDPIPFAVAEVSAGGASTCVRLVRGDVWCWGRGAGTGAGNVPDTGTPQQVMITEAALAIDTGDSGACALLGGGRAECWGGNTGGQLGLPGYYNPPTEVPTITDIAEISIGINVGCIRHADGRPACAGNAQQLGDASTVGRAQFGDVTGITTAKQVRAGEIHACALLANGSVRCWGANTNGQLGDGTMTDAPIPSMGPAGPYDKIAVGDHHTCGLRAGVIDCWGSNAAGQLGDGTLNDRPTAAPVMNISDAIDFDAQGNGTCALHADRTVSCWGEGDQGQVGDGSGKNQTLPKVVPITDVVAISGHSGSHSCALTAGGELWCWGYNLNGQLGIGSVGGNALTPVRVMGLP